jgi:hypothetical protein
MFSSGTSYIPDKDLAAEIEKFSESEKFFFNIMPLFNFIILA